MFLLSLHTFNQLAVVQVAADVVALPHALFLLRLQPFQYHSQLCNLFSHRLVIPAR
jgi:hypothetical protein